MWSHGHFYWNEFMTRDVEAAKRFYGTTLGWTFDAMPMPDGTYWVAKMGDTPIGGMFNISGPMFEGVPDHWFAYIAADNVDTRLSKWKTAGGKVMREPFDVPGVGRIAIVQDVRGSTLGLMTPAAQQ